MTKYHRFLHWFIIHNMILIIVGSVLLTYLGLFDGSRPIEIKNEPLMTVEAEFDENGNFVQKTKFKTGETLNYAFEYCKNRNIPAEMYGSFIDTVKIDMPVIKIKSPIGCGKIISSNYKIPLILPSGKYHFEVELIYQVNPIREVRVKYRTQDFQIINTKNI